MSFSIFNKFNLKQSNNLIDKIEKYQYEVSIMKDKISKPTNRNTRRNTSNNNPKCDINITIQKDNFILNELIKNQRKNKSDLKNNFPTNVLNNNEKKSKLKLSYNYNISSINRFKSQDNSPNKKIYDNQSFRKNIIIPRIDLSLINTGNEYIPPKINSKNYILSKSSLGESGSMSKLNSNDTLEKDQNNLKENTKREFKKFIKPINLKYSSPEIKLKKDKLIKLLEKKDNTPMFGSNNNSTNSSKMILPLINISVDNNKNIRHQKINSMINSLPDIIERSECINKLILENVNTFIKTKLK